MSLLVKEVKNCIRDEVISAANKAIAAGELIANGELKDFVVEAPADVSHGDYALNAALVWSKCFRTQPRIIAETILKHADFSKAFVSKTEIAGPGFINLFLSDRFYSLIIDDVLQKKENYGRSDIGKGKKVIVEFVSANPTGPMHIGNARGGALGDSIASVLEFAGYNAFREFYINDAGNQIAKFALSLDCRYLQIFDDSVEMPEDSYHGADIIEHANNFAKIHGDLYVAKPEDERRKALVDFALPKNIEGLECDLKKYRIVYDNWFKESSLHQNGEAAKVVDRLTEKGYTYEKEGAIWFKAESFGADKDFVLRRSNGFFTYVVPDIAYHYNKLVTRGFDKAIDVLGADHHGYVPRLKAALQALGVDPEKLDVVLMQMVRLVRGGETVKLSKRSGKAITLVTLLDEIPIDAARYIFNSKDPNTHLEFDLDLAVEQTSQNPVFYVQYANARVCSIIKNLRTDGIEIEKTDAASFDILTRLEERELVRHISKLTGEIEAVAQSYDSARITRYAYDLATLFHKFYNACRVKTDDAELTQARLNLCLATSIVLKNVLGILKIDAPESM